MPNRLDPTTLRWFASLGLLLLCSALGSADASAATPDRCHSDPACRAITERAMKRVQAFDYETALKDFQAAYAKKPEPRLLINIGRCYFRMSRPEDALAYYKRFQATPNFEPEAETPQAVKQYIAEAEAAIVETRLRNASQGRLVLSVSSAGAILIDGQKVADGPVVRSFDLPAGSHHVKFQGAAVEEHELRLELGKEVALTLGTVAPPVVAAPSERLPRPRWRLGVGGAAVGVGAVLVGLGIGALAVNGRCAATTADGYCQSELDENGIRMAPLYDSLGVGVGLLLPGLALSATGAVLLALPGPRREKARLGRRGSPSLN